VKIGKRPIYLATCVGLIVSSFWCATATSFGSLAAARAVQGFSMAPMEALIPASIADVWFVHERGFRTAVFNLGVLGGINLASPIAGSIIQNSSYRIAFHAIGGAFILQLILTWLFMPETAYHRTGVINIDTGSHTVEGLGEKITVEHVDHKRKPSSEAPTPPERSSTAVIEPKKSFMRELLPYDGYWDNASFIRTFFRPFAMLASPTVVWATFAFGSCISWLVLISITLSQIFSAPPYNFSVGAVGATNLSSFVASTIGTLAAGPLVDGLVQFLSKRNKGTFGMFDLCFLPC
jgi:MFS family permease